ncbi:MAG: FkbM family methyltransferase [Anaerolineales bacterium]|nr:FkbM family methyltransferase [Anaerolineales bacterium]
MRLKNERFFVWFNKLFFSLSYLLHQGKSEVVVSAGGGAKFWVRVNTSDRLMLWEIWKAKVYDDARLPIRETDTIVDLGAHIGAFSVRAARLAPRGQVYAYEPSGGNHALLTRNRQLNDVQNLHIENCAVSGVSGQMTLFTPAGNAIMGSLVQNASGFTESVKATTLHEIIVGHDIQKLDLLKVDVEGAEYDIFFGCPDESMAKIQRVAMEFHEFDSEKRTHRDLVALLEGRGFTVVVENGYFPQPQWFGTGFSRIGILKAWRESCPA